MAVPRGCYIETLASGCYVETFRCPSPRNGVKIYLSESVVSLSLTRVRNICRGGATSVCTDVVECVCMDVADAFVGRRTRRVRLEHASLVQREVVSLRFARFRVDSVGGGRDSTSSTAAATVAVAYEY